MKPKQFLDFDIMFKSKLGEEWFNFTRKKKYKRRKKKKRSTPPKWINSNTFSVAVITRCRFSTISTGFIYQISTIESTAYQLNNYVIVLHHVKIASYALNICSV